MKRLTWISGESPLQLVRRLVGMRSALATAGRKERLIAAACARVVCSAIEIPDSGKTIDAVEKVADGQITLEEALQQHPDRFLTAKQWPAHDRRYLAASLLAWSLARNISAKMAVRRMVDLGLAGMALGIIYDIAGPVLGIDIDIDALSDRWLTPDIRDMARLAYQQHDAGALPVIADALEEAGCDNSAILDHLRSQGACPECYGKIFVPSPAGHEVCLCGSGFAVGTPRGWVRKHACFRGCWIIDRLIGQDPPWSNTA